MRHCLHYSGKALGSIEIVIRVKGSEPARHDLWEPPVSTSSRESIVSTRLVVFPAKGNLWESGDEGFSHNASVAFSALYVAIRSARN